MQHRIQLQLPITQIIRLGQEQPPMYCQALIMPYLLPLVVMPKQGFGSTLTRMVFSMPLNLLT